MNMTAIFLFKGIGTDRTLITMSGATRVSMIATVVKRSEADHLTVWSLSVLVVAVESSTNEISISRLVFSWGFSWIGVVWLLVPPSSIMISTYLLQILNFLDRNSPYASWPCRPRSIALRVCPSWSRWCRQQYRLWRDIQLTVPVNYHGSSEKGDTQ